MSHSFSNINVHIIFHVRSTGCVIQEEHLSRLFHYIGGTIRAMSGHVYMVGGMPDHIHILTSLPGKMSASDFIRSIKANASRWIKGLAPYYCNFSWQEGYGVFSVSESNKEDVVQYIMNQKEHHRQRTCDEEFQIFLKRNRLLQ